MRCEQVRNLLNEYIEGSVSGVLREQLQAHLAGCVACQREWRFQQAIWRGLREMPAVTPPPDLHARIMTHVRANTRAREAQQRVAFWRWMGAAAVAASLFLMGFFVAQSEGVQATFGLAVQRTPRDEAAPQPVPAGVFVEYRTAENGIRLPVLTARMNREAAAELYYLPTTTPEAIPVWRGKLQPGKTVEIPLRALLEASKERVLTLRWRVEARERVLFVPAGYPPARLASVRLQGKLSEALRQLVSVYQTPIEWAPNGEEPLMVLEVQDASLEEALRQLLIGSSYTFRRQGEAWLVTGR